MTATMQNNTLLRFETFETNEVFSRWQRENPGLPIYQLVPVLTGMNSSHSEINNTKAVGSITPESYGLFVVYGDMPVPSQLNG